MSQLLPDAEPQIYTDTKLLSHNTHKGRWGTLSTPALLAASVGRRQCCSHRDHCRKEAGQRKEPVFTKASEVLSFGFPFVLLDYLSFFIPTEERGGLHSDAHVNGQFLRITSMRGLILPVYEMETNLNLIGTLKRSEISNKCSGGVSMTTCRVGSERRGVRSQHFSFSGSLLLD